MGKERLINKILKWLGLIKEIKCDTELKAEMCRKAVESNVCPNNCKHCAWNVGAGSE